MNQMLNLKKKIKTFLMRKKEKKREKRVRKTELLETNKDCEGERRNRY